jgi:adenosylcobinamide-phosphate synthase
MFSGTEPSLAILATALLADVLAGEPPNALHPVVWMGKLTSALERLAPTSGPKAQLVAGTAVALAVSLGSAFAAASAVTAVEPWPVLAFVVHAYLLKSTFAIRGLGRAALAVRDALDRGDVLGARHGLRSLCSRDPSRLAEPELVAATVESLAENTSDSFVAPLLFYVLFGLPGAIFYRAANTLDAMIGYHGRYEYLGKFAARLDDVLNWIPARASAAALLVAGWVRRGDAATGWQMLRRDGNKTESPNAGRPMAAMAGLLRVQLEKVGHYRLGDSMDGLAVGKIEAAWRIVALGAGLVAGAALAAVAVRHG